MDFGYADRLSVSLYPGNPDSIPLINADFGLPHKYYYDDILYYGSNSVILSDHNDWNRYNTEFELQDSDTLCIVFYWLNLEQEPSGYPAAIDNVVVYAMDSIRGYVTGAKAVDYLDTVTLTAVPNPGYRFVCWYDGDTSITKDVVATDNLSCVALFAAEKEYAITANVNPIEGGTIDGACNYDSGETATLTATANEGYTFINWTKDGEVVSTDPTYSFTVTEAANFVANFELNSYEVTTTANPEAGGTVEGTGTYNHGETATLKATANEGYTFINWTKDGKEISSDSTYSFTVTEAASFVANFDFENGIRKSESRPFTIYPIPTADRLFVESKIPIRQCEVYSINGTPILRLEECGENFEINVQHLASGTYLIRLTSEHSVECMRFVKI
ncbi:MAG: InlB B-repeat-containing protein [Bacteroidales bacterium]|nr:InlB B-repeat-containing protein [Bacteroidales bacterium]